MSNNVIKFPGEFHQRPGNTLRTIEQIITAKEDVNTLHVEEASSDLIEYIIATLPVYGFNFDIENNPELSKHFGLLIEALRSLMFKYYSIEHPLQHLTDDIFTEISPGTFSLNVETEEIPEEEINE